MIRIEGSGASQLVQLIRELGYNEELSLELATVTSAPPDLKIKVDHMNVDLEKDDLIVAESLTKHKRKVSVRSEGKTKLSKSPLGLTDIGFKIGGSATLAFESLSIGSASVTVEEAELEFADELKEGDRILVAGIHKSQTYIILDRVVTY